VSDVSGLDDARGGRHQHRGAWPSQRVRLTLLLVGVAVATIAVPPLIAPSRTARSALPAPSSAPSPTPATAPPSTPPPPATTTPPAATTPAVFAPVSIEAEAAANIRSGTAKVVRCDTCEGGYRVGYLAATSQLLVRATIPAAGTRTITVFYETDGPRTIKVNVNGAPQLTRQLTGPDWVQPQSFVFTVVLPAGALTLTFFNDEAPAPDIDKIVIA
jgi:hypothetical protein